jgi:hypothetical protein
MVRKLTFSLALSAACMFAASAIAQEEATTKAISAKAKFKMANYTSQYASGGCATCGTGGGSDSFATGAAYGGPHAMAYGRVWGGAQSSRDCARFKHYPYVYYPQNYVGDEYFRSSDSLYHRYPAEMQIPVYNRKWHNYYPSNRRYHSGHHFLLDVF